MKSQIDFLVEQRATDSQKTPEPIRRINDDTPKPERTLRKPKKRIADPRQIQSALGTWAPEDQSHDGAPMLLSTFSSPAKKVSLPQPARSWMGSPVDNNVRADRTPVPSSNIGHHLRNPLLSRPVSVAPLDISTSKNKSSLGVKDVVSDIDAQVSARLSAALETLEDDDLSAHFSDTTRRILMAKKTRDTSYTSHQIHGNSRREPVSSQSMYATNNTRQFSRASNATTTASNTDKIRDMVRRRLDEKKGAHIRRHPL